MNNKKVIAITVVVTVLIIAGGLMLYGYEQNKNQSYYEEGYISGVLYTSQSGNIVFNNNGSLEEKPIQEVCIIILSDISGSNQQ